MTEDSNSAVSSSFLLDDDSRLNQIKYLHYVFHLVFSFFLYSSFANYFLHCLCSIPFSVDDLSKSTDQVDISDVEPPPLIHENSGFSFLLPRAD